MEHCWPVREWKGCPPALKRRNIREFTNTSCNFALGQRRISQYQIITNPHFSSSSNGLYLAGKLWGFDGGQTPV